MPIVKADASTLKEWARLSHSLHAEHHTYDEMLADCAELLKNKKEQGFLYELGGQYVAFMNVSVRHDYVNGADTSPVAFVEGIFVEQEHRGRGIARTLIAAAEGFARENGCAQLASDCLITNLTSEQFHKRCGFVEKERVICFVKDIPSD